MKNVKKIEKSRTSRAENEHLYRYRSSCTGTPCAKMGSGQPVPVHPSSEQPIPAQVKAVLVQVVPAAPLLCIFVPLSPVFVSRLFRDPRND